MEPHFAAAVKVAVDQWTRTITWAERKAAMANPATLSAVLTLSVLQSLRLESHMPEAVRSSVLQAPFFHLKGVYDPGSLADTPTTFDPVPDTPGTVAGRAAALAVHGVLQLETISYGTENDGKLFVNLVPMPGPGEYAKKSRKELRGHTDGVSFPFNCEDDPQDTRIAPSPDLVTLLGLRNPKGVATKIMPLAGVLACLSPADISELKKPQYSIRSQKTFIQGMKRILGREHVVIDGPLLKDVAGATYVRYSHSSVVASEIGGPAEAASAKLEAVCNQAAVYVVVQPGDILIVHNRLSLHGRDQVGDDVGGHSRWLLRTYGLDTSSLPAHKRHLSDSTPHILFP